MRYFEVLPSSQICAIFERKKVHIPFVGRQKMCDPLNFLFEVMVSDLPRAGPVDRRQLDRIDWRPRCDHIVGVQTS